MLDRVVPFALVIGLSSIAWAGNPPRAKTDTRPPRAKTSATHDDHRHDDRFRDVKLKLRKADGESSGRVQVYVNGSGAILHGGFEDAARGHSSIVGHAGEGSLAFPAYGGGQWPELMSCVRDQFATFDIEISDQQPASDDFIMLMVGGSPALIGEDPGVAGIAPFMGSVIRGAVGFAFSEVHGGDVEGLCETVAHEIGHTLGLDHTYECRDTMSYLHCGPKSFVDEAMQCGEWQPRMCGGGSEWQSSHGELLAALGAGSQSLPEPASPEPVSPEPDDLDPILPDDPSDDDWWEAAGSDEWEEWLVWDPDLGLWLSWDDELQAWVVWAGDDEIEDWGEWEVIEEEWVEWEDWDEWSDCPNW